MFTECNAEIIINQVDNGFTLKWEKKKEPNTESYFGPKGFEVISTKEELINRIASLL